MSNLDNLFKDLEKDIQKSYDEGVTIPDAERLAAKFLGAQITISNALKDKDLDSRMRKSGLKSVKSAIYLQAATKSDKKPSDVMLNAIVDSDSLVLKEQEGFDTSEVESEHIQRMFSVAKEGHLYFRAISKGRFE